MREGGTGAHTHTRHLKQPRLAHQLQVGGYDYDDDGNEVAVPVLVGYDDQDGVLMTP
jgi:hypothetical protein